MRYRKCSRHFGVFSRTVLSCDCKFKLHGEGDLPEILWGYAYELGRVAREIRTSKITCIQKEQRI